MTIDVTFKKGQPVTYLYDWDRRGTVRAVDLFVYSAGKKQMILVDANGAKFAGHNFRPCVKQGYDDGCNEVHPRLTEAEANELGLALAERILTYERAHFARCLAAHSDDRGYCAAVQKDLERLHEARVERVP